MAHNLSLQEQLAAALQGGLQSLMEAQAGPGALAGQQRFQPGPAGSLFVPAAAGAHPMAEAESSDDLITPTNAEAATGQQQQQPAVGAAAALPSPPPAQHCLLCGGLGSQTACGPLRPATYEGQPVAVHHLCAIWSPGCFQREGSSVYVNLEEEVRRAHKRTCATCGQMGASLPCAHPGCRAAYHLPCAQGAPSVVLERDTFEVWCPAHADADANASDEDYSLAAPRPRRAPGGGGGGTGKRQRASSDAQRPRTDWQKRDDFTWLKVVPPWWCEHRTVHFASKVFKELFRSAASTVLVDPAGGEWTCGVQSEARNDMRPQYTLRGTFAELWGAQGICAGDTLIFKRDPTTGHIQLSRLTAGSAAATAARMEEATGSELSGPSAQEASGAGAGGRGGRGLVREASSEQTRGTSQQGSHPNRWMELADGWSIKTIYKSTLQHQQCPIAGWLFKKLYGRLPGDNDRAPMHDPDLDTEYRFDVHFIGAANVHYITGRTFSCWVKESGLQAGEQIRIKREGARVLIQRVPTDRKVQVNFGFGGRAASRSTSLGGSEAAATAAVAGAPAAHGQELASPPPADALEAMEALVAAAGFAGTHGTPAIQAALAGAAGAATAAAIAASGIPRADGLPQYKRRRVGQDETGDFMEQQEQQVLMARRADGALGLGWPAPAAAPSASLADWQPTAVHTLMLRAINQVLEGHEWSAAEQADCLRFRAKYAWLDACGREVVYEEVRRLAADKPALLTFLQAIAQGILMPLPAGAAAATPVHGGLAPTASPHTAALPAPSPYVVAANGGAAGVPQPAAQRSPQPAAGMLMLQPGAEMPERLHLGEEPLGLEGASSVLSLDLLMGDGGEAQHHRESPNALVAALGM